MEDNWPNDLTRSRFLHRVTRRVIFDTEKKICMVESKLCSASMFSCSTGSIRKEKLSDPLNKDSAAEGNESRIFRTALNSGYFGSELTTVTFFQVFA